MRPLSPPAPSLRTRILDATLLKVMRVGFVATTEQITQSAQVGAGSLTRHFGTKAQLLPAAFTYASDLLREPPPSDDTPPEPNLYLRCQQLWRDTTRRAVKHRAAFHYWRQYRASPQTSSGDALDQLQLGPFDPVPDLLQGIRGYSPYCALDACLLASQWTTVLEFVLANYSLGRGQSFDPKEGPTPGQLLDRSYEAWWQSVGFLPEATVRPLPPTTSHRAQPAAPFSRQ